jgi:hypothetical protein
MRELRPGRPLRDTADRVRLTARAPSGWPGCCSRSVRRSQPPYCIVAMGPARASW